MPGTVDGNIEIDENPWASRECTEQPDAGEDDDDEMVDAWNPDRPVTDIMSAFLGKDVGLPRRWLPHTSATSMFWLMLAQCELDLPETGRCSHSPSFMVHFLDCVGQHMAPLCEAAHNAHARRVQDML